MTTRPIVQNLVTTTNRVVAKFNGSRDTCVVQLREITIIGGVLVADQIFRALEAEAEQYVFELGSRTR
jgi:hypothetical protein